MRDSPSLRLCLRAASIAALFCCAPIAFSQLDHRASVPLVAITETASTAKPLILAARGHGPATRGPSGQVLFDSISGCSSFSRYDAGPSAILDDLSFSPGPAAGSGAVVTGLDFYIRTWGPEPSIIVRLTFFQTLVQTGMGEPPIVQHDQLSQQYVEISGAAVNTGPPGAYFTSIHLAPFIIRGSDFALEIAFVDDAGEIIANRDLSTVFPSNACAPSQPSIGSSQEVFWIDNDFGNLTGDNIRYEPADPSMPGNQGDALQWGGALPADNVLAVRIRGFPIESTLGACCMTEEPFACTQLTADDCASAGGLFVGLGEPCTPVFLCVPAPANDQCENASLIAGEGDFPFDTRGASSIGPDDCRRGMPPFGINSDVWFRWTAPCTGTFQLATCDLSITDDRIGIYPPTCDAPAIINCDDDSCETGFQSWLAIDAAAGQAFLIRLGAHPNTPGGIGQLAISKIDHPCASECALDFDGDGAVGVPDIFAFLAAWFQQNPVAWFFGGTQGGVPSIFAYLSAWFAHGQGPC